MTTETAYLDKDEGERGFRTLHAGQTEIEILYNSWQTGGRKRALISEGSYYNDNGRDSATSHIFYVHFNEAPVDFVLHLKNNDKHSLVVQLEVLDRIFETTILGMERHVLSDGEAGQCLHLIRTSKHPILDHGIPCLGNKYVGAIAKNYDVSKEEALDMVSRVSVFIEYLQDNESSSSSKTNRVHPFTLEFYCSPSLQLYPDPKNRGAIIFRPMDPEELKNYGQTKFPRTSYEYSKMDWFLIVLTLGVSAGIVILLFYILFQDIPY